MMLEQTQDKAEANTAWRERRKQAFGHLAGFK